jgi:hypothetical protein
MKILSLVAAALTFAVPSIANATCIGRGHVTQTVINTGDNISSFYITPSAPGSSTFSFVTTDIKIITAMTAAYGSNQIANVVGSAASCPAPVGGLVSAGTALSFQVP